MRVFVLSVNGKPLMPCSARQVRILLKNKQAIVVGYKPFTIKLQYDAICIKPC